MADKNFLISGTSINLSSHNLLKLPKHKFHNAAYFKNYEYQHCHEVADHYEVAELKQTGYAVRQRKTKAFRHIDARKVLPYEYQQVLPMSVHTFPSFEKIYAPRGRQTLCEERKPDATYNDTIKRIQSSVDNIELLKKEVERFKHRKRGQEWPNETEPNDFQASNKLNINKSKQYRKPLRRSWRKLANGNGLQRRQQPEELFLKNGCGLIRPFCTGTQHSVGAGSQEGSVGCVSGETVKYYLKLATDYYQQGFLQNINYLKNLEERTQLRRKRQLQLQQEEEEIPYTFGDLNEGTTNISTKASNSLESESVTVGSINSGGINYQKINKTNPIVEHQCQQNDELTNNEHNNKKFKNCSIRVKIKRQTAKVSNQGNFSSQRKEIYGKKEINQDTKDFDSMYDYFNGNLEYTQLQQHEHQRSLQQQKKEPRHYYRSSVHNQAYTAAKVLVIDALIDNLSELDIQESRTNIPRITLTDYTHSYPNEFSSDNRTYNCTSNPSKVNVRQSKLDIPLATHYQSEARPP